MDIESDLSAFHRVDDWQTLPGPRYFLLANRLGAYTGAVQARGIARKQAEDNANGVKPGGAPARVVSDTAALDQLANEGWLERT